MKDATVESDDAKEVVFGQVVQDVDQRDAGLDGKIDDAADYFIQERSLVLM